MTQFDCPYDALLVLSFGGPETNEEVVPFLRNVTQGRNIPDERLKIVGKHYYHFGGKSPLNDQNRAIIKNLETAFADRGWDLPIYFGNRNWAPYAAEAADHLAADGKKNILVLATSAWGGYSACLQYDEDIRELRATHPEMEFTKLRQFYDHPDFIGDMAEALQDAIAEVPADRQHAMRVLFTAHSIPTDADRRSGGEGDKNLYSRQVYEAARLIARAVGVNNYDVVWQSRSGNPHTPWLEPDIVDHTEAIATKGIRSVVVCPVGFITDHMEVIWDLDTDLVNTARDIDVTVHRARTSGLTPRFAEMICGLIDELIDGREPSSLGTVTLSGCTRNGAACSPGCCTAL